MYNCMFEDFDCNLDVELQSTILSDRTGYYIDILIDRDDVIDLLEHDVIPKHIGNGRFILRVALSNRTIITFNGLRLTYLGDDALQKIDIHKIILKQISLKSYSNDRRTNKDVRQCYATKLIFTIPLPKE